MKAPTEDVTTVPCWSGPATHGFGCSDDGLADGHHRTISAFRNADGGFFILFETKWKGQSETTEKRLAFQPEGFDLLLNVLLEARTNMDAHPMPEPESITEPVA